MSVEQIIAQLEREWGQAVAKGEGAGCTSLLADEYTYVAAREGSGFDIQARAAWLAALDAASAGSFVINDVAVSVHGSVAVATVLATSSTTTAGVERVTEYFYTDVWLQDGERWRVVERYAGHPTPA